MRTRGRQVMASAPALLTVPNIELLEVGEGWETMTGVFSFTHEDLVSAIQSQEDPAVRAPVVKLGHVDPRFDGQPALGRVQNLRLENNGQTLVGDLVGVPAWLAQVMYSAYPRRSIEGAFTYRSQTGNDWPFVLTGVALLGDAYPAISTLEDVQALWGTEPPPLHRIENVEEVAAIGSHFRARKVSDVPNWLKRKTAVAAAGGVQAATSLDEIRRAYYQHLGNAQMWWWIREMRVDPLELIVDDDEGGLYRVPVAVNGDDIDFGEPDPVKIEYVAATVPPAQPSQLVAASYADPTESGRAVRAQEGADVANLARRMIELFDEEWTLDNDAIPGDVLTVMRDRVDDEGFTVATIDQLEAALRERGIDPDMSLKSAWLEALEEIASAQPVEAKTSRHDGRTPDEDPEAGTQKEGDVQLTDEALRRLGLEPGASEEDINAAILQLNAQAGEGTDGNPQSQPETPADDPAGQPATAPEDEGGADEGAASTEQESEPEPGTAQIPEGMTLIDEATLQELRQGVAAARQLQDRESERERNDFLNQAVKAGKFPRSRREHYEKLWAADPAGTRQLIDSLAEGVVPVEETGTQGGEHEQPVQAAYPDSWKKSVDASARGAVRSRVRVVND